MQFVNATNDAIKLRIAAQLAPRRWRRELDRLRERIESGSDWSAAIDATAQRVPELGHLLAAALAAGHPASITLKLLQQRAVGRASWSKLISSLAYPFLLLIIGLLVGSFMSLTMLSTAAGTWNLTGNDLLIYDKDVARRMHDFYDASIGGLLLILWCVVLAGVTYCVATPNAWLKMVGSMPVMGRPYRWLEMSELLTRISIFSQYQPALEKCLKLTEQSFGSQPLAAISRYLVHAIQQGEALPNALHKTIVSDSRAGLALTLIESTDLSGSIMQAKRLLDEMILATCNQLRLILPIFIMLLVASIIWGTWSSYFELLQSFRALFYF